MESNSNGITNSSSTATPYSLLTAAGFNEEDAQKLSTLFQEHEIDASILQSTILNNEILKDIGISKAGHRLKILSIRTLGMKKENENVDYNQKPTSKLTFDDALSNSNKKRSAESELHSNSNTMENDVEMDLEDTDSKVELNNNEPEDAFITSTKYIPLRLSERERAQLHLVEAALSVSDYTGKVDIISYEKKSKRSFEQLKEICAVLSGLVVASDYNLGQKLIADRNFKDNEEFFQQVFEVGRRHKIMNPEKMRAEYGKLVYLLQDASLPEIQELMQFNCCKPVSTVYKLLEERDALNVLKDQYIRLATQCIIDDKTKSRSQVQDQIKQKEKAVEHIANKYSSSKISKGEIKLCLRSIGDNHSYLLGSRVPLDDMITLLTKNFKPDEVEGSWSLSISYGKGGARLNHDHQRQYNYVLQSLTLWRNVTHDMFKIWILAEHDLLDSTNRYKLSNTGQGLNRVQDCPHIANAMSKILSQTKRQLNDWVGSSVVHLGDHNVPNALLFIDKYTQIPRIINPVLKTIEQIDEMYKNDGIKLYIDSCFGGPEKAKKDILTDFFRHAFDGSGADNFFDAGSCIDGRLTSAWNWCEKLPKKSYYPIFKLSGFSGFDGDFQR